jgi:L-lactate utilization protein LutB
MMELKKCSPEESRERQQALLVQEVLESLSKRGIEGRFVRSRNEAVTEILALIPLGAKVAHGGSLTIVELGLKEILKKGNYQFIERGIPGLSPEDEVNLRRESLSADVFLCSTNALTRDGRLVNIDGNGNRVAAIAFGPPKVIVVAGINKVVGTLEQALDRVKNYAAPVHARRRGRKVPCVQTGQCVDCRSPNRICCITTIVEFQRERGRITVVLVGENLGL